MKKFCALMLFVLSAVALPGREALAHPHVWIQARAELVFDAANNLIAVRHVWEFDEGFSAYASQGLDENGDGDLSREELAELSKINVESLKDFEYFTFVQMGPEDPPYEAPSEYWLESRGGILTLFFTLPMEKPVAPDKNKGFADLTIEVFDATFFVDIAFVEDTPVTITRADGKKSACKASLDRPKALDPTQSLLLSQIGPEDQVPEEIAPQEGDLANTIRVSCPTS